MRDWNLLPLRDRVSPWRRFGVVAGLVLSACSGAAGVAWFFDTQNAQQAQVQADVRATQAQLARFKSQAEQLNARQMQWQQAQTYLQQVRALRQRAWRLSAVQQASLQHWPTGVQVQSWRLEGSHWQLQGLAESGQLVHQLAQDLSPWGPWQQPPALVELAALPPAVGQTASRLRYVLQARWREDDGPVTPQVNERVASGVPKAGVP